MTTTVNKSVTSKMRDRAAVKARQTGEHTVVFEAKIGDNMVEQIATLSEWEKAPETTRVNFLAVIDSNGNYVD
jgi:hypothetical protein